MCWGGSSAASRAPRVGDRLWSWQLCWRQLAWEFNPLHWAGHFGNGWRGFGNTSLGCQLLRRFIFRCWFAALTPRVYPGSQLHKLFPNSTRSLFTQHRQINSTVRLTHNCLLLISQTWHKTKGYCGNLSYTLAPFYYFKSLPLETYSRI